MTVHELRIWPEFFAPVALGEKTFELRKDDRGFRCGDVLRLREWRQDILTYTGRELLRRVTYLWAGMGLAPNYVCMSLEDVDELPQENPSRPPRAWWSEWEGLGEK